MQDSCSNPTNPLGYNVPPRLSGQRVSGFQDPHVQQFQAGTRTCPEDLCGESWPLSTRLWRCGPASSSNVSTRAMPNKVPAGRKTCLAGPLHKSSLLQNVTPAVVSRRVSFFHQCSKQPIGHRRQFHASFNLPNHSDAPDPQSGNPASHASSDVTRRGMQIFSPCPPRPAISVSPRRPGRFLPPTSDPRPA